MISNTHEVNSVTSSSSPRSSAVPCNGFVRDLMFANAHGTQPMSRAQQERINFQREGLKQERLA